MALVMENNKLRKTQSWNENNLQKIEDSKLTGRRTLSWSEKYAGEKQEQSKLAGLRQRRMSLAPDLSLPPIDENMNFKTISKMPASETSSGGAVFPRASRRASVASTTSLTAHWSAVSSEATPDSIFKREPWTSSPNANLNRRPLIARRDSFNRRGSVTSLVNRRASFRTIGNRVTTLLRAKNAFARLKRKPTTKVVDDDKDKDMSLEIKELPKQPRFASTLSAEAQYAIMKGYEDVVHNYLCKNYPEYRDLLRRSRTPPNGVTVKPGEENKHHTKEHAGEDDVDGNMDEIKDDIITSTPLPGALSSHLSLPSEHHIRPFPTSPLPYSRQDTGLHRSLSRMPTPGSRSLTHYRNLPNIAPSKDRQLVMTYRYQCAMDILDNIRQEMGLQPLSPRVKTPKSTAVKEFNSWSYVLNKEFEVK